MADSLQQQCAIDQLCDNFERAWQRGGRPQIDDFLAQIGGKSRQDALYELLLVEFEWLQRHDQPLDAETYRTRFADDTQAVEKALATKSQLARQVTEEAGGAGSEESLQTVVVENRYQLLRQHGQGGLGRVWIANDLELSRRVALKEILPRYERTEAAQARFLREIDVAGSLSHPGIISIIASGRRQDGQPFYLMPLIGGEDLAAAIQRHHAIDDRRQRQFSLRLLLQRFIDVCHAVHYAHRQGVIHRDLKPSNIMLGDYGETIVIDWGLSKRVDAASEVDVQEHVVTPVADPELTLDGEGIGTACYMSPEQADAQAVGKPSDIYNLGATLYHLLVGHAPVQPKDGDEDVFELIRQGRVPPPRSCSSDISRPLDAICRQAMNVAPAQRYASADLLAQDIERCLADEPVEAYAESGIEAAARWTRRHLAWMTALLVTLAFLSASSIIAALLIGDAQRAEHAALSNAQDAARDLEDELRKSNVRGLIYSSQAIRDGLPRTALLLGIEALRLSRPGDGTFSEAYMSVHEVMTQVAGNEIHAVPGGIDRIAVSRDGRWLACLAESIWLVDLKTAARYEIHRHGAAPQCEFSRDSRWLICRHARRGIELWRVPRENEPPQLAHSETGSNAILDPQSEWLVIQNWGGSVSTVVRLDLRASFISKSRDKVAELPFRIAEMSLRDDRLVARTEENRLFVWRLSGGKRDPVTSLNGNGPPALQASLSPDQQWTFAHHDSGHASLQQLSELDTVVPIHVPYKTGRSRTASFSPNSRWLVTDTDQADKIAIWDLHNPAPTPRLLKAPVDAIRFMCRFSPDSSWLLCGNRRGSAAWQLDGDAPSKRTMKFHGKRLDHLPVRFSPDSRWAVYYYADMIQAFDLKQEGELNGQLLQSHTGTVNGIAFSPDARYLISMAEDSTLGAWDLSSGASDAGLSVLRGHEGGVSALAYSHDGETLYSGSRDGVLRSWPTVNGRLLTSSAPGVRNDGLIFPPALEPSGKWLAVVSGTLGDRLMLFHLADPYEVFETAVAPLDYRVDFSPDGKWMLSSGGTASPLLRRLDQDRPLATATSLASHQAPVEHTGFSPDGRQVLTHSSDGVYRSWSLSAAEPAKSSVRWRIEEANGVRFLRDGKHVMTQTIDPGSVCSIWKIDELARHGENSVTPERVLGVTSPCTLSPDGNWLVEYGPRRPPLLARVKLDSGDRKNFALDTIDHLHGAEFISPNKLVGVDIENRMILWDLTSKGPVLCLQTEPVERVVYKVDESASLLVRGDSSGSVETCELNAPPGRLQMRSLRRGGSSVTGLEISPNDDCLVIATEDGAEVWKMTPRERSWSISESIEECVFSPDGRWLFCADSGKLGWLWRLAVPDEPIELRGHLTAIRDARFTPDSRWLVTRGDQQLQLWDLDLDRLAARVRRTAGHPLSPSERARYHVDAANSVGKKADRPWLR